MLSKLKELFQKSQSVVVDKSKQYISSFLPANPVIIEAGVADGKDTFEMSKLWPEATIYGFEPHPYFYKIACEKNKKQKNVNIYQAALAEKDGYSDFNVSKLNSEEIFGSSSLLTPKEHLRIHPQIEFKETIQVKTFNLDQWAQQNNIEVIDFMWLDMQGIEPVILRSSPNVLQSCSVIFTEVSLIETYEGVILYPEFKIWMQEKGFKVQMEDLPYKDMGNVLFVRQ